MRYMLLIYGDEKAWASAPPDARTAGYQQYTDYSNWLREKGWMVAGEPLHDTGQATSVRAHEGERVVTDGPFAETKEQLGGYYIIETDNLDDAIEAAARCPAAHWGTVEVRPMDDMEPSEEPHEH
jgi:hypothetical protein